jgi:hypothetical protein
MDVGLPGGCADFVTCPAGVGIEIRPNIPVVKKTDDGWCIMVGGPTYRLGYRNPRGSRNLVPMDGYTIKESLY